MKTKTFTLVYGVGEDTLSQEEIQQLRKKHELIFAPTLDDALIAVANAAKAGEPFQKVISPENAEKITELSLCVKYYFADAKFETFDPHTMTSYFAFGEHWDILPEYAGYEPIDQKWEKIKMLFDTNKYGPKKPLFLNVVKGNIIVGVYVYGFNDLATPDKEKKGVALCKVLATKRFISISW